MASESSGPPRLEKIQSPDWLGARLRRWWTHIVFLLLASAAVAGFTLLNSREIQDATPATGSMHIESVPSGADVTFDGTMLSDRTPVTIDGVPVGTRHRIVLSLRHYQPYTENVMIPRTGSQIQMVARLTLQDATGAAQVDDKLEH